MKDSMPFFSITKLQFTVFHAMTPPLATKYALLSMFPYFVHGPPLKNIHGGWVGGVEIPP